jgi:Galactose-3-O-sulfotransferase
MTEATAAAKAVIFLHIPKTAGTTLNRLIEWEYDLFEMYSVDPVFFKWSAAHLRKLSEERLRKIRVFKGHMLFGLHEVLPQPATYTTVLRDPIERTLSAFYFMRSYKLHPLYWKFKWENWTLEDFVRRLPRENVQCKIVAGAVYEEPCTAEIFEQAKHNLDQHFGVVGLSERFEETLALMKLRFGWKLKSYSSFNITRARPKKRDLSQPTLDLISEKNSFDVMFYDYAARLFQEAVDKNAAEVSRIAQELGSTRESAQGSFGAALFSIRSAGRKAISRAYSSL